MWRAESTSEVVVGEDLRIGVGCVRRFGMGGVGGRMDGWMDGWVGRWMDGWMDGEMGWMLSTAVSSLFSWN